MNPSAAPHPPQKQKSDEQLMRAYYRGRDEALEAIFRRYSIVLRSAALKRLPQYLAARRELAEDLVSNTFSLVVATRKFDRARWCAKKGEVRVWLGGILRNQVVSFLRLRKGKEVLGTDRLQVDEEGRETRFEETIADPTPGVEARLSLTEELRALEAFMAALPAQHRDMLTLKYQQALSHAEIGELFEVSVPTVSRRLHESRRRLLKFLERPASFRA